MKSSPPQGASKAARVYLVDILRLIASAQMINGHTLDALLLPSIETGPVFERYVWFRGLVSVAFLLVAGLAYYLATVARFDAHKAQPGAVMRRFRRGVDLLIIGYLLHFPYGALSGQPESIAYAWRSLAWVDVLQCIGVALITLETLTWFAKNPRTVIFGAASLTVGCVFLAPLMDGLGGQSGALRILTNYLSHQGGSPFPLFPWAGYIFFGVVVGAVTFPAGAHTPLKTVVLRLSALAVAAYGGHWILKIVPNPFVMAETHVAAIPRNVFDKLVGILAILLALSLLTARLKRLPNFLSVISRETLFVYWFHIVVLFHLPFGLAYRLGLGQHGLTTAFAASAGMLVVVGLSTVFWHRLKAAGGIKHFLVRVTALLLNQEVLGGSTASPNPRPKS